MTKDDRELIERLNDVEIQHWLTCPVGALNNCTCRADEFRETIALAATRLEALQAQPVGERGQIAAHFDALAKNSDRRSDEARLDEVAREIGEEADRHRETARTIRALALTASPPVVEREAIARIIDPDCAKVTWAGTDDEQHIVRMRVCRERLKQWGDDGECDHDGRCEECSFDMAKVLETDASKARRAEALAKADAILALTPVEGVGVSADVRTRLLDLEDAAEHAPEPLSSELLAVIDAVRSTPVAQGDEVRSALEKCVSVIKLFRQPDLLSEGVHAGLRKGTDADDAHIMWSAIANSKTTAWGDAIAFAIDPYFSMWGGDDALSLADKALATLTKGARDAG